MNQISIIGAGFAALSAARKLRQLDAQVVELKGPGSIYFLANV